MLFQNSKFKVQTSAAGRPRSDESALFRSIVKLVLIVKFSLLYSTTLHININAYNFCRYSLRDLLFMLRKEYNFHLLPPHNVPHSSHERFLSHSAYVQQKCV